MREVLLDGMKVWVEQGVTHLPGSIPVERERNDTEPCAKEGGDEWIHKGGLDRGLRTD